MEGVQQGPKGCSVRPYAGVRFLERGQPAPPHQVGGLEERCKLPQWGLGWTPDHPTVLFLCALADISCCISGAFCTRKIYTVQRGKGCVRFLKAM